MDGINPTLAFAVLLLGISGNAREAPDNQLAELSAATGCPAATFAVEPQPLLPPEGAPRIVWSDRSSDPPVPDVIVPDWADGTDPIARNMTDTGLTSGSDGDPCESEP